MISLKPLSTKLIVSLVAVGSLTAVGAGVAAASSNEPVATHHGRQVSNAERRRLCEGESNKIDLFQHRQAHFAHATAYFMSLETRAEDAGNTHLAKYWESVVNRRVDHSDRARAGLLARERRDARTHHLVNGRCF